MNTPQPGGQGPAHGDGVTLTARTPDMKRRALCLCGLPPPSPSRNIRHIPTEGRPQHPQNCRATGNQGRRERRLSPEMTEET